MVREKTDAVIDRLVQMIVDDPERNLLERVRWGLKEYQPQLVARLKDKIANASNQVDRETAQTLLKAIQSAKAN